MITFEISPFVLSLSKDNLLTPDLINSAFEAFGGVFILGHCRAVLRDRAVAGVSISATVFFTLWGVWNLYYYPSLNQPLSFYAGCFLVAANCLWIGLLLRFRAGLPTVRPGLRLRSGTARSLSEAEGLSKDK